MITTFRVRNLRSIKDSQDIPLKRLTVLVGKNSAGKSTLLRVLPLLRQSAERPTKGPILWYGRFVDFGNFKNAVNADNPRDGITLEFTLTIPGKVGKERTLGTLDYFENIEASSLYSTLEGVRVRLTVGQGENDETGKARSISVDFGSDDLTILFKDNSNQLYEDVSVVLNGRLISAPQNRRWTRRPGKVLPIPLLLKQEKFESDGKIHQYWSRDVRPFSAELSEEASKLLLEGRYSGKSAEVMDRILYADSNQFYAQLAEIVSFSDHLSDLIKVYNPNDPFISSIRELTLLANLTGILNRIDDEITQFSNSIKYIEPLRATAERYYRLQDLAVDEIDSRGENTAMFLNSLAPYEMNSLRSWMESNLGFSAHVKSGSGHIQVFIEDEEGHDKNIADLGFGYSQLLPIILQIWMVSHPFRSPERNAPVIAIEQPELHLHPQFQAQIADVLASVTSRDQNGPRIFLETHSEHLINRLGELISSGALDRRDIQILVVDQSEDKTSSVTPVYFDESGYLDASWPSGFFVPDFSR